MTEDITIWTNMMDLSKEMEAIPGVFYTHDPYQATVAAI